MRKIEFPRQINYKNHFCNSVTRQGRNENSPEVQSFSSIETLDRFYRNLKTSSTPLLKKPFLNSFMHRIYRNSISRFPLIVKKKFIRKIIKRYLSIDRNEDI